MGYPDGDDLAAADQARHEGMRQAVTGLWSFSLYENQGCQCSGGVTGGPAPSCGGGGKAGNPERGDGCVADGRSDLGGCSGAGSLGVFFHGDVADVVPGLDLPIAAGGAGEGVRCPAMRRGPASDAENGDGGAQRAIAGSRTARSIRNVCAAWRKRPSGSGRTWMVLVSSRPGPTIWDYCYLLSPQCGR